MFVCCLLSPLVCSACSCKCSNCTQVRADQDDRDLVDQLLAIHLPSTCGAVCLRWDGDLKSPRAKSRAHLLFLEPRCKSGSKHIRTDESCKSTRLACVQRSSLCAHDQSLPEQQPRPIREQLGNFVPAPVFFGRSVAVVNKKKNRTNAGRHLVAGELNRIVNTTEYTTQTQCQLRRLLIYNSIYIGSQSYLYCIDMWEREMEIERLEG